MKRSDIDDDHVLELAQAWHDSVAKFPVRDHLAALQAGGTLVSAPGVVTALVAEGVPEKLAVSKVLHMADRGLLDYGTSPYHAWPA